MLIAFLLVVFAYLIGSISFARVVSRAMRLPDPKSYGSGNPGATNVLRTGNKVAAALTLLGDFLKGFLVVFLTIRLGRYGYILPDWTVPGVALAVFLGHIFPCWYGFNGGKGVATVGGIMLGLNWVFGVILIAVWFFIAVVLKVSSLAALVAAVVLVVGAFYFYGISLMAATIVIIAALVFWRHRGNIERLLRGKEDKIK
jgi:glycerol-3-phosphate acyltransferase PlsY